MKWGWRGDVNRGIDSCIIFEKFTDHLIIYHFICRIDNQETATSSV